MLCDILLVIALHKELTSLHSASLNDITLVVVNVPSREKDETRHKSDILIGICSMFSYKLNVLERPLRIWVTCAFRRLIEF